MASLGHLRTDLFIEVLKMNLLKIGVVCLLVYLSFICVEGSLGGVA